MLPLASSSDSDEEEEEMTSSYDAESKTPRGKSEQDGVEDDGLPVVVRPSIRRDVSRKSNTITSYANIDDIWNSIDTLLAAETAQRQ